MPSRRLVQPFRRSAVRCLGIPRDSARRSARQPNPSRLNAPSGVLTPLLDWTAKAVQEGSCELPGASYGVSGSTWLYSNSQNHHAVDLLGCLSARRSCRKRPLDGKSATSSPGVVPSGIQSRSVSPRVSLPTMFPGSRRRPNGKSPVTSLTGCARSSAGWGVWGDLSSRTVR